MSEVTIKYKAPLRGQEEFLSCFNVRREGIRFIFDQDIYRKRDGKLCVSATLSSVLLVNGVLDRGDRIAELFAKYL